MFSLKGIKWNKILSTTAPFKSLQRKSHYDTLNLKSNCTQKDIKKAFITLSKEHHPDKQIGNNSHDKFVKILEAYKVLSKPESRADYDLTINSFNNYSNRSDYQSYKPVNRPWENPQGYGYPRNPRKPYYDPGLNKRVVNSTMLTLVAIIIVYITTLKLIFDNSNNRSKKWMEYQMELEKRRSSMYNDKK